MNPTSDPSVFIGNAYALLELIVSREIRVHYLHYKLNSWIMNYQPDQTINHHLADGQIASDLASTNRYEPLLVELAYTHHTPLR